MSETMMQKKIWDWDRDLFHRLNKKDFENVLFSLAWAPEVNWELTQKIGIIDKIDIILRGFKT